MFCAVILTLKQFCTEKPEPFSKPGKELEDLMKTAFFHTMLFIAVLGLFVSGPAGSVHAKKINPAALDDGARIDALIATGASLLNDQADWIDRAEGRKVYDRLLRLNGTAVTDGIVRAVLDGQNRLHVLFLGVKLGIAGSQERLNSVLMQQGDKKMAEDFLNSGSRELHKGGERWAESHGYFISTGMGSHRVGWGQF